MLTKGKSKKASKLQQKSWHKIIQKHVFNEHLEAYRKKRVIFYAIFKKITNKKQVGKKNNKIIQPSHITKKVAINTLITNLISCNNFFKNI
jgi:hypothetical protein